jgi:hypothetical protein
MNKDRLFYLFIFSGFLLIYLLSISQNIAISHDSIFYVLGVKQGLWEFHPHHLLYHIFNQAVYSFVRLFFENADVSFVMSAVNSVFGALTISVIVKIINKIYGYDKFTSLAYAGIIAFSYGVWFYSACVEVYIIPLYFIVLSYYSFLMNKNINAGIYAGIATLFHQMYIFMLPVLLISWFAKKVKFREMLNSSLYYSAIVGIPYILVLIFYYNVSGISDSLNVLTKYAHELPQHWSSFGLTIVINDIIGLGRSVLSIHYLFGFENIQALLFEKFPHNSFMEEIYLVRNMPDALKYILAAFSIILVFAFFRLFVKAIAGIIKDKENLQIKVWFMAYVIIFGLFFSFWSSNNPEFWISIYTVSMLSIFRFLKPNKTEKLFAGIMFVLMLLFNLLSTIQYAKDPMNDFYLNRIHTIEDEISEKDIFIYDANYMVGDYFRYLDYNNTLAVSKHNSVEHIFSAVDTMKTESSKIFLIESAFSPDFKISEKYKNFRDTISQKYELQTIEKDEIKFEIIKY